MAFPTTSVLDDFNRGDGALGSNWPSSVTEFNSACAIASSAVVAADAGINDARWITSFGPDTEVFATVGTIPAINTRWQQLFARIANPSSASLDCYAVRLQRFDTTPETRAYYFRYDNGTATQLGLVVTGLPYPATGQKHGLAITGSTLTGYQFDSGVWTAFETRSDPTYSAAGYIGLGFLDNNCGTLDDFGGGDVVSGGIPPTVTGTLQVGQILTVDPGDLTPISYVWNRADDTSGTNLVTVGSTGATYTVAAADENKYIRAGVLH